MAWRDVCNGALQVPVMLCPHSAHFAPCRRVHLCSPLATCRLPHAAALYHVRRLPRARSHAHCLARCSQGVQADPGVLLPGPGGTEPEPARPASTRRSSAHGSSTKERGVQCELLPPQGDGEGEDAQGETRVVIKVRQRTRLVWYFQGWVATAVQRA